MSEVVHYDSLVESYYENLHTTLRKFSAGPEYLDSWVHDENHVRSLVGIFESAEDSGLNELTVVIGPEVAAQLDRATIQASLGEFGTPTLTDKGQDLELKVVFENSVPSVGIHEAYQKRIADVNRTIGHRGSLAAGADGKLLSSVYEGVTLHCAVNASGTVTEARFEGSVGALQGLMERFCQLLEGRPLQEGSEHGVIRLEDDLRDRTVKAPVEGIVTPQNADPLFKIPLQLVRTLFRQYRTETGAQVEWNIWEESLSSAWTALTVEQKIETVTQALTSLSKELGLAYTNFEVLALKNDYRIVLSQDEKSNDPQYGHDLIALEQGLQKRIERRLELVLESLEDKNHRESRTKRDTTFNDRPTN